VGRKARRMQERQRRQGSEEHSKRLLLLDRKGNETELREARETRGLLPVQTFVMTFLKLLPSLVKGLRERTEVIFLNKISTEMIYVFRTAS
jgi:hypothetical protein